jgi:hypothetical protein
MKTPLPTLHNESRTCATTEPVPGRKPGLALLIRLLWAAVLVLPAVGAQAQGIDTTDPNLPPNAGYYMNLGTGDFGVYNRGGESAVLYWMRLLPPRSTVVRTVVDGTNEVEQFTAFMFGFGHINCCDSPWGATGSMSIEVFGKVGNTTGTFNTQMLPFDFYVGGTVFRIRLDPTRTSTGRTTITDIGGGLFHIDSVFDIYTDFSFDEGISWAPQSSPFPTLITLVGDLYPAPSGFEAWQLAYFGCTNCPQAATTADPDGDGMVNAHEFLAGFCPTNSAAYPHIISLTKAGNDMNVTYLGANGDNSYTNGPASCTNVLEYTSGTADGSYTNNFVSTGQTNILSDGTGLGIITNIVESGGATNTPSRYYRVRVLVP